MTESQALCATEVEILQGVAIIGLAGELDLASLGRLRDAVERLDTSVVRMLCVDISELEFLDCSGLRMLIEIAGRDSWAWGGLLSASAGVRRLLALTESEFLLPDTGPDAAQRLAHAALAAAWRSSAPRSTPAGAVRAAQASVLIGGMPSEEPASG